MELEDGVSTALAKSRSIGIIIPITFSSNTGGVIEGCSKNPGFLLEESAVEE